MLSGLNSLKTFLSFFALKFSLFQIPDLLSKEQFEIKTKISKEIKLENIEIIDNSHKHRGHRFFSKERFHLHLKIKSIYLSSISRLNAQKLIMKILKDDLQNKIHALEISIEQ